MGGEDRGNRGLGLKNILTMMKKINKMIRWGLRNTLAMMNTWCCMEVPNITVF